MRTWKSLVNVGLVWTLLVGCGSSVESGGTGGSGAGGGTTTTSTSTGTTATTTTTSGASCTDFLPPDDLGAEVEIRLANATAADLYLGDPNLTCGWYDPFSLTAVSGDPPASYQGSLQVCEQTCSELQTSGCECAADCAMPLAVRITPGGVYVSSWRGFVYDRPEMPAECFADPVCGPLCALEAKAPPSLRVRSLAYSQVTCATGLCSCTPDADGSCVISDGPPTVGGETLAADTVWQAGEASVTITFGP
jgi:hypothetical protein